LVGGWFAYDGLCRSRIGARPPLFGIIWFCCLTVVSWALTRIFSDRAAFLHVGAIIGTAMVANVFFVIIPNQKRAVAAMLAGQTPEARLGREAKQRSLHNNYMTLPAILCMISNHFPMLFSNPVNWLLLATLSAAAVMIRLFFNLRHRGILKFTLLGWAAALFVLTILVANEVQHRSEKIIAALVPFSTARALIDRHCIMCHSANPTHKGIFSTPAGLDFTRDDVVRANAARIRLQAVTNKVMPLGNESGMTEKERQILGAWITQGAK
jgi:uncharacterized membrane protein